MWRPAQGGLAFAARGPLRNRGFYRPAWAANSLVRAIRRSTAFGERWLVRAEQKRMSESNLQRTVDADPATHDLIFTRDLIEPIFMRTVYVGIVVPALFAYLGSSGLLAQLTEQAQWLVSHLASIWPVLPRQYELVLKLQGPGQAASYGFFSATLCAWPVICALAFVSKHQKLQGKVRPVSPKEIGQFLVVAPWAFFFLMFDQTRSTNPLYGFHADQREILYFRQWIVFALPALVMAIVVYVVGRAMVGRIRRLMLSTFGRSEKRLKRDNR
jgi:hypothetical protein